MGIGDGANGHPPRRRRFCQSKAEDPPIRPRPKVQGSQPTIPRPASAGAPATKVFLLGLGGGQLIAEHCLNLRFCLARGGLLQPEFCLDAAKRVGDRRPCLVSMRKGSGTRI